MFKRITPESAAQGVAFDFEGRTIAARPGDTVAAALLAAGETQFRTTPEKNRPRGPFCMMGVCFDCLMVIDGEPNRQACQVLATEGMRVRRQKGAAEIGPDDAIPGDGA
jgi:succinate dehydrogenase/fumarate reductase-like Fe-S protein